MIKSVFALLLYVIGLALLSILPVSLASALDLDRESALRIGTALASLVAVWLVGKAFPAQRSWPSFGALHSLRLVGLWVPFLTAGIVIAGSGAAEWLYRLGASAFVALDDSPASGWIAFLSIGFIDPLAEELLFRGVILRLLLASGYRPAVAVFCSALLFGAVHGHPVKMTIIFAQGLLWGTLAYRTRSLWPGLLGHVCNNGLGFALELSLTRQDIAVGPWILTGTGLAALGLYGLMRANRIAAPASYSTPIDPPRSPITVE